MEQSVIKNRQKYYWLGKKYEDAKDYPQAIETYKIYSTHLSESSKHIPHLWISWLYDKIDDLSNSLTHLEIYAAGCTAPKAAEVFKEVGEKYLSMNAKEDALRNFQKAIDNNPNIGVKKKIDELRRE